MRRLMVAATILVSLAGTPAFAAAQQNYTPAAFQAAQKAGEPILVWVHATWCPTCAAQAPTLSKLEADPKYVNLKVFVVDFDSQKDVVKAFGVRMQSTLIAFHGAQEQARSTGQTDPAVISALVAKTES